MVKPNNKYTELQKKFYVGGTTNHEIHNDNKDYWDFLLSDLKDNKKWVNKKALDFACGKGRNILNMLSLCDFIRVDGIDISNGNIEYCKNTYDKNKSEWYVNNGVDVSDLNTKEYDFIMSTIALQHIPVYDIRKSLISDLFRTLKDGGVFSFQMGYGDDLIDGLGRKRVSYFDNFYDATGTNSEIDVRITNVEDVKTDLEEIGFKNITFNIKPSFSDFGHNEWVYIRCEK